MSSTLADFLVRIRDAGAVLMGRATTTRLATPLTDAERLVLGPYMCMCDGLPHLPNCPLG